MRTGSEGTAGVDHDRESASGGGTSHGGPTQSAPIWTAWWNSRQRSSQPSAISVIDASGNSARTRSAASPYAASSTEFAFAHLLEPVRRQLDEASAELFGTVGRGR